MKPRLKGVASGESIIRMWERAKAAGFVIRCIDWSIEIPPERSNV